MLTERGALLLSGGGAAVLGSVALAMSAVTGSGAILLDGMFDLCFVVTAILTLRVATLIERPDDAAYPFGYIFFEPLINTAKGLLILGVSLFALADAGIALAAGGRTVTFGPAMAYAAGGAVVCLVVSYVLWRSQRATRSPLVAADVEAWLVSAAISVGVLVGFIAAAMLAARGRYAAANLVDPAMMGLVVLLSIAVPIRMAVGGLGALLNRAAEPAVVAGMEALVRGALGDLPVSSLWIRAIQPGRTAIVAVHVVVPAGTPLDLATGDRLRGAVIDALVARHAPIDVDVIFTAVEAYAAPTAGYQPGGAA